MKLWKCIVVLQTGNEPGLVACNEKPEAYWDIKPAGWEQGDLPVYYVSCTVVDKHADYSDGGGYIWTDRPEEYSVSETTKEFACLEVDL